MMNMLAMGWPEVAESAIIFGFLAFFLWVNRDRDD